MGLAAWAQARRRLPFGDRLVRHPQRQAAAPPKAGFIRSPIPDLEFHLPEMMPTIGVVLVRHQKETRSVASGPAFYRLLPPKRQDIAVSVQPRPHTAPSRDSRLPAWIPFTMKSLVTPY